MEPWGSLRSTLRTYVLTDLNVASLHLEPGREMLLFCCFSKLIFGMVPYPHPQQLFPIHILFMFCFNTAITVLLK